MTALVLGHKNPDTDSIVSALSATYLYRARGIDAVSGAQGDPSPETAFVLKRFGLKAPEVVHSVEGREVYLVDYSDLAQAPDDFPKCRLLGIIDHHKLGDVTSDYPLECWIQPVGCSNTIVKLMYDYYKVEVPKDIAGAMLCAILSDTVLFRSPTCTPTDIRAAKELAAKVTAELESLAMSGSKLEIRVSEREHLDASGADGIDFLFTPFPGSPQMPMGKSASGGELSRLMLALELVAAEKHVVAGGSVPPMTFIFDEVDAGVGGKTAVELGARLAKLAQSAQVIVVTHLPQVASWADEQYVVAKGEMDDGSIATTINQVRGEARVHEIARMLSGSESEASLEHAEELLKSSVLD